MKAEMKEMIEKIQINNKIFTAEVFRMRDDATTISHNNQFSFVAIHKLDYRRE